MENVKIWIDGIQKDVFGIFYVFDSKYYFIYTEKELDENNYVILYMTMVGKETKNTENGAIETGAMIGVEITNPEEQQKAQTAVSYIVEDKKNNTTNPQIQYLPMSMIKELKIISKKRFRLLKSIMEENFKLDFTSVQSASDNVLDMQQVVPIVPLENQTVAQPLDSVIPQTAQPVSLESVSIQSTPVQDVVQPVIPESVVIQPTPVQDVVQPVAPVAEVPQPIENNAVPNSTPVQQIPQVNNTEENVIIDYRSKYFEEQEKNKELQAQVDALTQKLEEVKKVIN